MARTRRARMATNFVALALAAEMGRPRVQRC